MNLIEYSRMYESEERHWWYVGLHRLILAAVRKEVSRQGRMLKIFDAGCGTGRLCQLLKISGHHVTGCDASDEAIRFCRLRGLDGVIMADLNDIELEPESFDIITSVDVLYHEGITDDGAVLEKFHNALKPGGLLILNLVAHEFLRSTHDIAVHTRERYTRSILEQKLRGAGFEIIATSYRVSILFPLIAAFRIIKRIFHRHNSDSSKISSDVSLPNSFTNGLLLKILTLENRMILSGISLPVGSSVYSEARKVRGI
jgi:SAM-dependent methyltransferase